MRSMARFDSAITGIITNYKVSPTHHQGENAHKCVTKKARLAYGGASQNLVKVAHLGKAILHGILAAPSTFVLLLRVVS